jgi:hypothetical protein
VVASLEGHHLDRKAFAVDVLVLNAAYQPVSIVSWRSAVTKMYSAEAHKRVEIVSSYADRYIKLAQGQMPMPSVVRHIKFNYKKNKGIKFSRDNVWARDRGRCQYCGIQVPRDEYTYDHVIPKSKWAPRPGSPTIWTNIVAACTVCNGRKGSMTVQEAKMKLLAQPVVPVSLPSGFSKVMRWHRGMPEDWKMWFGAQYFHGGETHE